MLNLLHPTYPTSPLFWALLGGVVLLVVGLVVVGTRREVPWVRWVLLGLRGLAFVLVALLLLRPAFVTEREKTLPPRVGVLVDTSASMAFEGRLGQVAGWLRESSALSELQQRTDVAFFSFNHTLKSLEREDDPVEALAKTAPSGSTHLVEAARSVWFEGEEGQQDAVLLVSDGLDTDQGTVLFGGQARDGGRSLFSVMLPEAQPAPDIAILEARLAEYTYLGELARATVILRRTAGAPAEATVSVVNTLPDGPETVTTREISFAPATNEVTVNLEFPAETTGHQVYEIRLATPDGIPENNAATVSTVVVDGRRSVLLTGRPSWDYRFIHRALDEDAGLRVNSLPWLEGRLEDHLMDATVLDAMADAALIVLVGVHPGELSEPLGQRFTDLVENEGKGFAWFLGNLDDAVVEHFQIQADLLGVVVDATAWEVVPRTKATLPMLERQPQHLRLRPDTQENLALWRDLVALGRHPGGLESAPVAEVSLVDAATENPILVEARRGEGRTSAFLAEDIWNWSFRPFASPGKEAHGNDIIRRIALKTLPDNPDQRLRRRNPTQVFLAGAPVVLEVEGRDAEGAPLGRGDFTLAVAADDVSVPTGESTEVPGRFRFNLGPVPPGSYRVSLTGKGGPEAPREETWLLVREDRREFLSASVRADLLTALARRYGGETISWDARETIADVISATGTPVPITEKREIWDTFPVLALLTALLGGEWYLRKKRGLR